MKYAINLFPTRRSVASVISNFAVYYLRYVLVFTLLIIIVIFFLRMKIDQKLIDERGSMSQKKEIVEATAPLSRDLEQIRNKVKEVESIFLKQDSSVEQTNYLISVMPSKIALDDFRVSEDSIVITAKSQDARSIQSLQKRLAKDAIFAKIETGEITRGKDGAYDFSLTLSGWKKTITSAEDPSQSVLPVDNTISDTTN